MAVPTSGIYAESGMATLHNRECVEDARFKKAYARGVKAIDEDYNIRWRAYTACWAANQALQSCEGDFVECGVNKGFMSSTIMDYLDWNQTNRDFYLVDTYEGIKESLLTEEEKKLGYASVNKCSISSGFYVTSVDSVRENFSEWTRAHVLQGFVPDILPSCDTQSVAFLHLDMNNVTPEKAAAEYFWSRIPRGGVILLDDYAFVGYSISKNGMDAFAKSVGHIILSLPTGQGLLIKH